jgi:hypothetical protein
MAVLFSFSNSKRGARARRRINFYLWGLGEIGKSFGDASENYFPPQLPAACSASFLSLSSLDTIQKALRSSSKNRVIQVREQ